MLELKQLKVQATEITYELHSLGWKAFQDLCVTVISDIFGQTVQSFFELGIKLHATQLGVTALIAFPFTGPILCLMKNAKYLNFVVNDSIGQGIGKPRYVPL